MIAHPTTDKLKPIGIFLSITLALSSIYYFLTYTLVRLAVDGDSLP